MVMFAVLVVARVIVAIITVVRHDRSWYSRALDWLEEMRKWGRDGRSSARRELMGTLIQRHVLYA